MTTEDEYYAKVHGLAAAEDSPTFRLLNRFAQPGKIAKEHVSRDGVEEGMPPEFDSSMIGGFLAAVGELHVGEGDGSMDQVDDAGWTCLHWVAVTGNRPLGSKVPQEDRARAAPSPSPMN